VALFLKVVPLDPFCNHLLDLLIEEDKVVHILDHLDRKEVFLDPVQVGYAMMLVAEDLVDRNLVDNHHSILLVAYLQDDGEDNLVDDHKQADRLLMIHNKDPVDSEGPQGEGEVDDHTLDHVHDNQNNPSTH